MADDEITNMFLKHLDNQGLLTKIKAQIKATVYKVMDQSQEKKGGTSYYHWENPKAQELHKNKQCVLILQLIKEFLQFFDFDYTLSVLSSECNMKEYIKRDVICEKIGIKQTIDRDKPVLEYIFQQFTSGAKVTLKPTNQDSDNETPLAKKEEQKAVPVKPGVDFKNNNNKGKSTTTTQATTSVSSFAKQNEIPKKQEITKKVDPLPKEPVKKMIAEFEEIEEDEMPYEEEKPIEKKKESTKENPMFTSSEDFLASQSQGFDVTVDSEEIDQYDYIEEIHPKK